MGESCDYLICADYIVTQNEKREIVENGVVAVRGDVIADVGGRDAVAPRWNAAQTIDLGEAVLLPGLINGHTHIPMSFLRGYSDDKNLMDWLQQDIFPIEDKLTPSVVETAAAFSCAEMLRTGTTAFFDMYMMMPAVFRAVDRMGMRAVLGESVTHFFPSLTAANAEEAFLRIRRQKELFCGHPLIRQAMVPHAIYTTDARFLRTCREIADELECLFGMHLSETRCETENCLKQTGKRPVEYCRDLGLLMPDATFFHTVDINEADLRMLADAGCAVVHNPASNMKLASGAAPIGAFWRHGIPVGLGTDGPASNNAQNMVREMYTAALLQKVSAADPTAISAQRSLDMATRGGAAALHDPTVGSLAPGMKADLCALSLTEPNMQPVHHIVSNIVYAASGMENRLTMVNGRILFREGDFLHFDYEALRGEMLSVRQWVARQNIA